MDPITDLQVSVALLSDDSTQATFSFVKPSGNIGGYYVYMSTNNQDFTQIAAKVDMIHGRDESISTYDLNGRTYYIYTISSDYANNILFFRITAVSTSLEESVQSSSVSVFTYPYKITSLFTKYDGYVANLSWDFVNNYTDTSIDLTYLVLTLFTAIETPFIRMEPNPGDYEFYVPPD